MNKIRSVSRNRVILLEAEKRLIQIKFSVSFIYLKKVRLVLVHDVLSLFIRD